MVPRPRRRPNRGAFPTKDSAQPSFPRRSDRLHLPARIASPQRQLTRGRAGRRWFAWLNPRTWRRPRFTWRKLLIYTGGTLAVFAIMVTGVFAYYVRDLPNPKQLSLPPVQSTKILDRTGKALYSFHGEENRTVVTGEQISTFAKQATIGIEDKSFYSHHGFSPRGITRAVYYRIIGKSSPGGGSTITQQYIKNAFNDKRYSMERKLRELILAIEVEQMYSKDEILVGYMNQIPYGNNAYGIEAAAQLYFGKPAAELTLSEAATLAAIPQRPSYYSPYGKNLDRLFERKAKVLNQMVEAGFITQEQADTAKTEAPSLEQPTFKRQSLAAPHFVFYVRDQLIEELAAQNNGDEQEAERQLDEAGWVVTTSIDMPTQELAEKILSEMGPEMVKKYQASNAAITAVDPRTGEVLAMVGSIDYETSKSGNTNFAAAALQPGSSFKPYIYATAFSDRESKRNPASITFDLPTDFGKYEPKNYDGRWRGPITNRNALAQSLNIPAVKNFYLAGVKSSIETAKKLGITTLTKDPGEYGLSLVLGSGEVQPVEMAAGYSVFANGGSRNPLRPILKIEKDGQVVKDYTKTEPIQALDPEVAYQISSILSDNAARTPVFGSRNNLILKDRPVAAKSGSTQNNRDAWTVGFTPSISVAVWVGNNEPKKTMTKGADGSYVAAPIWNRFMREYLADKPVEQFVRPDTMKEVTIDMLSGKLPTDQSPPNERVTEFLAPWQVPTEQDDVHVKLRIDRVTGKIATDLTPADQIEERYFIRIHSEVPDKPGWENAVREWARSHGGSDSIPTEKDDLHTEDNRPSIRITAPAANSQVSGSFRIAAEPGGSRPISKVEFFLNSVAIGTRTEAPWEVTYDASTLPPGTQTIQVTVTNDLGLSRSEQLTISPDRDSSPPGNVSSVSLTDGSLVGSVPIRITWKNPSNSDLVSVHIYQSTTSGALGTQVQAATVTPDSDATVDIPVTSLTAGTYYFTLRPVDSTGNENQSTKQYSVKVL